jgi:hypothetical protein
VKVLEAIIKSVVSASRFASVSTRWVLSTLLTKCARRAILRRYGPKRLGHHDGPEIAAPDADVDDVGDRLAGVARVLTAAHGFAELAHVLERRVHVGHDVAHRRHSTSTIREVAQRAVQHGAAFGGVDGFAGEHRIAQFAGPARARARTRRDRRIVSSVIRFLE